MKLHFVIIVVVLEILMGEGTSGGVFETTQIDYPNTILFHVESHTHTLTQYTQSIYIETELAEKHDSI